ncbi:carboxylesterase family protein [Streptomyces olivaceus]|uniref:carboxylesterase family protein n=1 Tax=Streptomyces olivaceus TaxID=47716 RepID=UPI0035D966B1
MDVRDGLDEPVGAEDCLTLNVFRPSTAKKDLPVVVFVQGRSNVVGYSADPMYDGRALARGADAVVVTVNYRLGVFGWLDLPGLKTGYPADDSGNFGTLDQIEALRFLRRNASAFGGDASNMTVMASPPAPSTSGPS